MRHFFVLMAFFIVHCASTVGAEHAFILHDVDTNQVLIQEGDVTTYRSPYCTFNIVLSLIGFDTTVLKNPQDPTHPFKKEYEEEYRATNTTFPEKWRASHNPASWMNHSCVWFSQLLTRNLGMKTLSDYVINLGYGNQNLVGDLGKNNGLTRAWIGSSLRISPLEQVRFINRLVKQQLPVSIHAHECTKAILFVEELPNGMKLYGKTGSGDFGNGREEPELKVGWFVGYVEKENKRLTFAYLLEGVPTNGPINGMAAREELKQRLLQLT